MKSTRYRICGYGVQDPFPTWRRRGQGRVQGAELLVRTDPEEDGTDGFFLAVFQRSAAAEGGDVAVPEATLKAAQRPKAAKGAQKGIAAPGLAEVPTVEAGLKLAATSGKEPAAVVKLAVAGVKRVGPLAKPAARVAGQASRAAKPSPVLGKAAGFVKKTAELVRATSGVATGPVGTLNKNGSAKSAARASKTSVAGGGKPATSESTLIADAQPKVVKRVPGGAPSKSNLAVTAASKASLKPKSAKKEAASIKPKPAAWV